jgi:long-chain acyl-CoA synthetase
VKRGLTQHEASPFFDNLVFNKVTDFQCKITVNFNVKQITTLKSLHQSQIKQGLGGRVRIMISGAAPLPKHVEEFMRVTSGSMFVQGYGIISSIMHQKRTEKNEINT